MIKIRTANTGIVRKYRCKYIFGIFNFPLREKYEKSFNYCSGNSTAKSTKKSCVNIKMCEMGKAWLHSQGLWAGVANSVIVAVEDHPRDHPTYLATNFSILFSIDRATSKPPITKNVSTAMGWMVTNAEKSVFIHFPSMANTAALTFGKPRVQPKRWPSMMWSIAKVRRPARHCRTFDCSLLLTLNNFAPFL